MKALINAIQRALEFLHSWVVKAFTFSHNEWMVPWADKAFSVLRQITYLYAAAAVLIAMWIASARDFGVLMLQAVQRVGEVSSGVDAVFTSPTALVLHNSYAFANYLFPVNELFTYLIFFVGFKSIASGLRVVVKVYELIPFKMS